MDLCKVCENHDTCVKSGIELPFIRRLMIASSVVCEDTIHITHDDEAKQLGYVIEDAMNFVESNKFNCHYFNEGAFSKETEMEEAI